MKDAIAGYSATGASGIGLEQIHGPVAICLFVAVGVRRSLFLGLARGVFGGGDGEALCALGMLR
jgi:hypothetical protein